MKFETERPLDPPVGWEIEVEAEEASQEDWEAFKNQHAVSMTAIQPAEFESAEKEVKQ